MAASFGTLIAVDYHRYFIFLTRILAVSAIFTLLALFLKHGQVLEKILLGTY